jgi:hypothetical protein
MNGDLRSISILDAPSNLGLKPPAEGQEPGVKWMAQAIRSRGLVQRLGAIDAGKVEVPAYDDFLDPRLAVRNPEGIVVFARRWRLESASSWNRINSRLCWAAIAASCSAQPLLYGSLADTAYSSSTVIAIC